MLLFFLFLCNISILHGRSVHVSISTDWTNYPIAEIVEYLSDQSNALSTDYLMKICESGHNNHASTFTYEDALHVAGALLPSNQLSILKTTVGLGYYKPKIQFQQTLSAHYGDPCDGNAFFVLHPGDQIYCDYLSLSTAISELQTNKSNEAAIINQEELLSSNDKDHTLVLSSESSVKVILYGSYLASSYCSQLREVMTTGDIGATFVTRYASLKSIANVKELSNLHGYGVFLDIKNMEYKTLDDQSSATSSGAGGEDDLDAVDDEETTTTSTTTKDKQEDEVVAEEEETTSAVELKKIKDLGLQVIATVLKEEDHLGAFEDIVCNFPSRAARLSKKRVTRSLRTSLGNWYQKSMYNQLSHNCLYVNGLRIDLSGASFNIFDVFSKLTKEMHHLRSLSFLPVSASIKAQLLPLAMSMNSASNSGNNRIPDIVRIDVSLDSKRVITFMNNLERDTMYRKWPKTINTLLQPAWSLHSVQKNIYTTVMIVDPLSEAGISLVLQARDIWQQQFPIRFGFVLSVSEESSSSSGVVTTSSSSSLATRRNICDLFAFAKEYMNTGVAFSFLFSLFEELLKMPSKEKVYFIETQKVLDIFVSALKKKDKKSTRADLLALAITIISHEIVRDTESTYAAQIAVSDYREVAGLTRKYLVSRNLPANSFSLNGIVVPTPGELYQELMQLLGREQYLLGIAVREGRVSDTTKSIFTAMLEDQPGKCFARFHPLIFEEEVEYIVSTQYTTKNALQSLSYNSKTVQGSEEDEEPYVNTVVIVVSPRPQGFLTIAAALTWLSTLEEGSARLAITLSDRNISSEDGAVVMTRLLIESYNTSSQTHGNFDFDPIIDLFSILGTESGLKCVQDTAGTCDVLSLVSPESPSNASVSALITQWKEELQHCQSNPNANSSSSQAVAAQALKASAGATESDDLVLLNSRILKLQASIEAEDLRLLSDIEAGRITRKLHSILREEERASSAPPLSADDLVDITSVCGRYATSSASRVDVAAVLSSNFIEVNESDLILQILPNITTAETSSDISIFLIVDPLTTAAQRAVSVMKLINQDLELPFTLIMVPLSFYESFPLQNFYRFVLSPNDPNPSAVFDNLPRSHILTVRPDVPESWNTQAILATQDIDNLKCDGTSCGDASGSQVSKVTYKLKNLLVAGQCYESKGGERAAPPNGLQLILSSNVSLSDAASQVEQTDSLVMQNYGYFQFKSNPGLWYLQTAPGRASRLYTIENGGDTGKPLFVDSFVSSVERIFVNKRAGMEAMTLQNMLDDETDRNNTLSAKVWNTLSSIWSSSSTDAKTSTGGGQDDKIHVFSLATGHMYERLLRIMMLSVTKRTSVPVKFWLLENYLSPTFKTIAEAMSQEYGFEIGYVTYKWPEWLTQQTEKQRIIWGYKVLFLDVLFPLEVKKIIYIDADQIMRADLKELWEIDLMGKPYAYTPFCASREETLGYQFWRTGFWASHLQGKPYHISALYVVDLELFRKNNVGDQLRAIYDGLARDPNSLSNLDQDLPNYAQHSVPIHSLPQEWLWCESWCSDDSKVSAKTIDLCNNPKYKEPKLDMARRIISGHLFNESWIELDDEIRNLQLQKGIA